MGGDERRSGGPAVPRPAADLRTIATWPTSAPSFIARICHTRSTCWLQSCRHSEEAKAPQRSARKLNPFACCPSIRNFYIRDCLSPQLTCVTTARSKTFLYNRSSRNRSGSPGARVRPETLPSALPGEAIARGCVMNPRESKSTAQMTHASGGRKLYMARENQCALVSEADAKKSRSPKVPDVRNIQK